MIKYIISSILLLSFAIKPVYSQYKWSIVPSSPQAGSRFNDCSFVNPNTGWVCSADTRSIYKTTNAGNSWFIVGTTLLASRCIVFLDSLKGFTGEYNSNNRMNVTTDGGITWSPKTIPSPSPTGLCGFSKVNSYVVYGCGRYWGPARVVKTTDAGNTWQNIDMSSYAAGLVDCKFFTPDSGFVVGRASGGSTRGIILFTSDGGSSWDTSHITSVSTQWCWKINFVSHNTGFVSLEAGGSAPAPRYFLKTTNRGLTWQEKIYSQTVSYDAEGIGFVNEMKGWIGGWSSYTYETTDGGETWYIADTTGIGGPLMNINRFLFLSDTLGFAVGKRIYKYSKDIGISINPNQNFSVKDFKLYQNYPNPFNPKTKIKFELPVGTNVRITIHDILGKEVATIIEGDYLSAGDWEFEWDASDFSSGVYYFTLYNNDIGYTKSMVLIK